MAHTRAQALPTQRSCKILPKLRTLCPRYRNSGTNSHQEGSASHPLWIVVLKLVDHQAGPRVPAAKHKRLAIAPATASTRNASWRPAMACTHSTDPRSGPMTMLVAKPLCCADPETEQAAGGKAARCAAKLALHIQGAHLIGLM